MKKFLVDSNILIDYMRGLKSAQDFLSESENEAGLYLSVVSIAEVFTGADTRDPRRLRELEELVSRFEICLITSGIARQTGFFRRDYKKSFADMLIAATAVEYDLILVTRNTKDFIEISELKLLKPYG